MQFMLIRADDTSGIALFEKFVEAHPRGHFLQSPAWGRVKSDWEWFGILAQQDGQTAGALSVLSRRIPALPFSLLYAPRGPVCDPHDVEVINCLIQGVKTLARGERAYRFLMDPDILISDRSAHDIFADMGFTFHATSKNFEGIQPRFVYRLFLTGHTEESLLAKFQPKTRYNIRLAQKHGVEARVVDSSYLPQFYTLMQETGIRDGFLIRPLSYFQKMMDQMGEHCRLYMCFYHDKPICGAISIAYGSRVWYLYGASGNSHRQVMPNYLVQWEMIRWALSQGCEIYDFRGVSGDLDDPNNPLAGLLRFKKGFNGTLCEFIGELDLIISPFAYFIVGQGEKLYSLCKKGLRILQKRGVGR